jgi:hypothetical protein
MANSPKKALRLLLMAAALLVPAAGARAQYDGPGSWPEAKCARYKTAYAQAVAHKGLTGIGKPFLDSHDAFLASGCLEGRDVCPRSKEELDLANTLVILGMNQGMSSTFLPFACRKPAVTQP